MGSLLGVAFSAPATVWAYGGIGLRETARPLLQVSGDYGDTWEDVSSHVNFGENRVVQSVMFSDRLHGWLVFDHGFALPLMPPLENAVLTTEDGGENWQPLTSCGGLVWFCRGEAFCATDARSPLDAEVISAGPAPGSEALCADALPPDTYLHDVRPSGDGVACTRKSCRYTSDRGANWSEGILDVERTRNLDIRGVVLTATRGWAPARRLEGDPDFFFLESADCGRSWSETSLADLGFRGLTRRQGIAFDGPPASPGRSSEPPGDLTSYGGDVTLFVGAGATSE